MGRIRDLFRADSGPTFSVDQESVPPEVFGLTAYVSPTAVSPRIDRRSAIQVPAVKRSRDLIAGTLGGLPLDCFSPERETVHSDLLEQPEKNRGRSITMAKTFEDMFFEGIAWWKIVESDPNDYPTKIRRVEVRRVTVDDDRGKVYIDGKEVSSKELIRFDAPTDGLLIAGSRAIRTCLQLDAAAAQASDGTPPLTYFVPADDADPFDDDDDAKKFLTEWSAARREHSDAYVPARLKLESLGWDPEKLQLAQARQHAVLEIARMAGVDPEELGVSTTSRTYANQFDRRKAFLDFTLGQYRQAFEDRLSMPDVTPRGFYVKFNLDAFLRTSTKERYEAYALGINVGALDQSEIRDLEDKPPLKEPVAPAKPKLELVRPPEAISADTEPVVTFADEPEIRLDMADALTFAVDYEARTISGLLMPYGKVGIANGMRWVFSQGTIKFSDPKRIKMWIGHDKNDVRGYALTFDDRPDGLYGVLKVEAGEKGDEALRKADPDGSATWDAFSIGLRPGGRFRTAGGINYAIEAPLMEVSLTPAPSFEDARVHQVAASATLGEKMTPEQRARLAALRAKAIRTSEEEAELVTLTSLETANPAVAAGAFGGTQGPTFDTSAITAAISAGFEGLQVPARETVNAADEPTFTVDEAPLYRFDGIPGQRSLTEDMRDALRGNSDARQMIDEFFNETFAVTSTNVTNLNPTENRPDLYVPNLQYTRPLWEMVTTGTIDDKTPFTIPKFNASSGLVGDHTEGTEPTPGSFSATVQTVTPAPISGKIEINREVLDQGGSPQADQIIWGEIMNAWYEGIEAKIAARLATTATAEINLASAVDSALVNKFTDELVALQFARGGNRFTGLALDGMTFPKLVAAADSTGRKLLPLLGPTNAQGTVTSGFDRVSIGGLTGRAAWALGATNASKSYLFVPSSVYAWASAPKRLQFEYQVKSIDLGIWGYAASAITRDADVKPIDYTAAD